MGGAWGGEDGPDYEDGYGLEHSGPQEGVETIESVMAERNWLANRLSYLMNGPLAGTPCDNMTGWNSGVFVRPSPEQVLACARSLVVHGDSGYYYPGQAKHPPLPTNV